MKNSKFKMSRFLPYFLYLRKSESRLHYLINNEKSGQNTEVRFKNSFSLLEVILAMTILTVGIVAVISVLVSVLSTVSSSRNNLVAAQLAQEGIEIIRNFRDSNWLSGVGWRNGLAAGTYRVEWKTNGLLASGNNKLLWSNISKGFGYNYTIGGSPFFRRSITITDIGDGSAEFRVVSEVKWEERGQTRLIQVEDHLFNWY